MKKFSINFTLLAFLLISASLLALSFYIHPSPQGYGSHQQLGLPPCPMIYLFGIPCPSCGLTTSFAHMARLQWIKAFHCHPLGPFMFLANLALLGYSFINLLKPKQTFIKISEKAINWTIFAFLILFFGVWIVKIFA